MPKLSKKLAKQVDAQESVSFEPVPPGRYLLQLLAVTVEEGPKGPYWKWELKCVEPEEYAGRKFWLNTSLSENALWKMKEVFEAFGYTTGSDTDEMCGEQVYAQIGIRTIQSGQRAGEEGNEIQRLIAVDADADADADAADEADDEEDEEPEPAPARGKKPPQKPVRKAPPPPPDDDDEDEEEAEDDDEDEDEEEPTPRPARRTVRKK